MEVENGLLEDHCFPYNVGFSTSMLVPEKVSICISHTVLLCRLILFQPPYEEDCPIQVGDS